MSFQHNSIIVGCATDQGPQREQNEDSYGAVQYPNGDLIIVCDGMGGHAGGAVASSTAIQQIISHFNKLSVLPHFNVQQALGDSISLAHNYIYNMSVENPNLKGMGTTLVMAFIQGETAYIAHLGDSRLYHFSGSKVKLVTLDHDRATELLAQNIITEEEYLNHSERGVLSRALGVTAGGFEPSFNQLKLQDNDSLLLCTDGAYSSFENDLDTLSQMVNVRNVLYGARNLIDYSVQNFGEDNATIIIGRYVQRIPSEASLFTPTSKPKIEEDPYQSLNQKSKTTLGLIILFLIGIILGYVGHRLSLQSSSSSEQQLKNDPSIEKTRPRAEETPDPVKKNRAKKKRRQKNRKSNKRSKSSRKTEKASSSTAKRQSRTSELSVDIKLKSTIPLAEEEHPVLKDPFREEENETEIESSKNLLKDTEAKPKPTSPQDTSTKSMNTPSAKLPPVP